MIKFIAALIVAFGVHAQEAQIYRPLQGVTFERQSYGNGTFDAWRTERYDYGAVKLPAWPGNVTGRGYLSHITATARPPGASVMWGSWVFRSKGLFTTTPGAHVAFVMRATSTGTANTGYGFIVGGLSGFTWSQGGACASGVRSQPETWHELADGTAGNVLYGGAQCGPVLQDWRQYRVTIHAAATGYSYTLRDVASATDIFNTYVAVTASPSAAKIENSSGWTAGIVFGDVPGTSWQFEITDMQLGWF